MFGIGFSEMILLGIIVLVFIGPDEIPVVARSIGRFLNELKRSSDVIKDELNQSRQDLMSEVHKVREDLHQQTEEAKKQIHQIGSEAQQHLSDKDDKNNQAENTDKKV